MNLRIFVSIYLLGFSVCSFSQSETSVNVTDNQGRKQGHWIKKYPNEAIMYDGFFKDDKPVGELRRYFENKSLKSILVYSDKGRKAVAEIYHENGYISAKGIYIDQMKEGIWQFFSEFKNGYKVSEETYVHNLKNGPAFKFFPDSTIAEKTTWINDVRQGEWTRYYSSGKLFLKSYYMNGKINGKFEVWFENGSPEYSGQYKDDSRDGQWIIYNKDGSVKYNISYVNGITNDRQMDIDASDFLDSLENNMGKIADPEKTGLPK